MEKQSAYQIETKRQLLDAMTTQSRDFLDYDPVGLPDDEDIKNIKTIMRNHEKVHPLEVAAYIEHNAKERNIIMFDPKYGDTKSGSMRNTICMPGCLLKMIEDSFPLMFSNKSHIAWFKNHFRQFVIK